jgi:hypothetical protein
MQQSAPLSVAIDVHPGDRLVLPDSVVDSITPGRWLVTISPIEVGSRSSLRDHTAFLRSYAPEDEGLYDDFPSG